MSFLLDTDIVSAYHKRTMPAKLKAWLKVNEGDSFISVLTVAEMRHGLPGVAAADHATIAERIAQTEVSFIEALEGFDVETLVEWKRLLANLKTINRTMTCEDSLIAASALAKNHTLVTNNTRHFEPAERFGLKVINPLA
jgi:predicted nucleic acid-binding protein